MKRKRSSSIPQQLEQQHSPPPLQYLQSLNEVVEDQAESCIIPVPSGQLPPQTPVVLPVVVVDPVVPATKASAPQQTSSPPPPPPPPSRSSTSSSSGDGGSSVNVPQRNNNPPTDAADASTPVPSPPPLEQQPQQQQQHPKLLGYSLFGASATAASPPQPPPPPVGLPIIHPVTDDELVRYSMISVNAIRNHDVSQLRSILRQHQEELHQQQQQEEEEQGQSATSTTATDIKNKNSTPLLSWFDGRNRNGESLLHLACRRSTVEVVQFLLHEAHVNVTVSDLHGRTCWHDICWRPRVQEALPIFHIVHAHYVQQLASLQQPNPNTNDDGNNDESQSQQKPDDDTVDADVAVAADATTTTTTATTTDDSKNTPSQRQGLAQWPLQPDTRGHVCFDYCRQEHWYEWNTFLQQQLAALDDDNSTERNDDNDDTNSNNNNNSDSETKSDRWCTIG